MDKSSKSDESYSDVAPLARYSLAQFGAASVASPLAYPMHRAAQKFNETNGSAKLESYFSPQGMYKGFGAYALRCSLSSAIGFGVEKKTEEMLAEALPKEYANNETKAFAQGLAAGTVETALTAPTEMRELSKQLGRSVSLSRVIAPILKRNIACWGVAAYGKIIAEEMLSSADKDEVSPAGASLSSALKTSGGNAATSLFQKMVFDAAAGEKMTHSLAHSARNPFTLVAIAASRTGTLGVYNATGTWVNSVCKEPSSVER